ncbi:MAG: hypothetical protein RLZZ338_2449 [Cyanobacteriota bacterium]
MLHDLAMEQGRDLHTHGVEYFPGSLETSCIDAIGGFATAIDSLAAIKLLIYDTKRLTWDQLLNAIEKNWEGEEAIRQICLNAPKYGNGIEWTRSAMIFSGSSWSMPATILSLMVRVSTCVLFPSPSMCLREW